MATKIFMGDMPELMEIILNLINNEFYSLYSCALLSIYPVLESKVEEWIIFQNDLVNSNRSYKSLEYHIFNSLFKLFVESGATLHKLDLYFTDYGINSEIFYSLGEKNYFSQNFQDLSFYLGPITELNTENAIALLKILVKNATELNSLKLDGFYPDYEPQLLHALICIIKSQEQLRQFSLVGGGIPKEFYGVISALENQSNSLQEVIIENCAINTEFKVLMNCKNLEILRIKD
ncbi:hypothetical protein F8M41_023688 [Gigaspora margarita]|uniref:Uncharacterized protein n=1 Tax=Gigaspora margarita TaxID=4874 RepID=A0A8H4ACX1_GIGMA|nr:hypothetical protein F8M41_023688 [Gigaspora margarita]